MSAETGGGRAIPRAVEQAIEKQRAQLMRVSTVLACLWISTLYQEWHDIEIEADDVALILRRLIDEAVDALDIVVLARAAEAADDDQHPVGGSALDPRIFPLTFLRFSLRIYTRDNSSLNRWNRKLNGSFVCSLHMPHRGRSFHASSGCAMRRAISAWTRTASTARCVRTSQSSIGTQGIAFDRVDLDSWADHYKDRNGRPAAQLEWRKPWETEQCQGSPIAVGSGTSTSSTEVSAFVKALDR